MAEQAWWEIGRNIALPILVLLIFLGFYFFYEGGAFPKVQDISRGLKNYVNIGAEKGFGSRSALPEEQTQAIVSLKETMKAMKASGETDCFAQYTPLPPLGREKGTTVELAYEESEDATYLTVKGGAEGVEVISSLGESLKGIRPCLIAGKDEAGNLIEDNFRRKFLNKKEGVAIFPYRQLVGMISLPLQDNGWLFTPGDGEICFFPSKIEEESIPFLIRTGKLSLCTAAQEAKKEIWKTYTSLELFDYLPDNSAVNTIRQPCEGFVGKDCSSESYRGHTCSAEFPITEAKQGCLVMATAAFDPGVRDPQNTLPISCSWWESPEGQMLISSPSEYKNMAIIHDTYHFYSSSATKSEELNQKEWLSLPDTALLCANKKWYECNNNYLDQETTANERTYVCTEESGVIMWREK